ncbi:MAG: SGNH/GDSL hydrolase family protein [Jatrophihabitans sp.]
MTIAPPVTGGRSTAVRPRLRRLGLCAIVVALLLSGGDAAVLASGSGGGSAVRLAVIGDSLSTGLQTPGDPWTAEAQELFGANGRKVDIVNAAENGAGYVAQGEYGNDFLDQVNHVVDARSQVVVVFGSDNDLGRPSLAAAVTNTLERIKTLAPRATLVVVGPPAPPAQSSQSLATIRDALGAAARDVDGQFVDPLSLKWFQGDDAKYVSEDEEHPDTDGERYLAQQMTDVLTPTIDRLVRQARWA